MNVVTDNVFELNKLFLGKIKIIKISRRTY